MKKIESSDNFSESPKVKRPGVHSKNKSSRVKNSKNYKKLYRGQG